MKYTKLGKSDLKVSRICMGCMGFGDSSNGQHGWTIDEPSTREIIKYGLEKGINFYDTAIAYQNGTSEQYIGISNCFAWLLTKVTSPVVGATKMSHVDGAVKAIDIVLSDNEINCLEELYVPHALAGVMAQNGKQKAGNVV